MANKSYRKTVIIIAGQLFSSTCCCLSSCYQGFEDGKMQMATDWFEPWSNVKFFVFLQFYILNLTCDFSNSRQIVTLRFLWKIRENSLPSRIFLGGKMQLATDVCNWDNGFSSDVAKLRRLDSTGCTLIQNTYLQSNKRAKMK